MPLAPDKRAHLLSGFLLAVIVLCLVGAPAAALGGRSAFLASLAVPFLAVVVAGIVKEVLDRRDPEHHTCDPWDAIATIGGGLLIIVPIFITALLWRH